MVMKAPKPEYEGDFERPDIIPATMHQAVCYQVIDLGTHPNDFPGAKEGSMVRQVLLTWELPNVRMDWENDDGEVQDAPRVISKTYTRSMGSKANLRKHVESWLGVSMSDDDAWGFDIETLVGRNAMLQIVHKRPDKPYAVVNAVMPLMDGMEHKTAENEHVILNLDEVMETGAGLPDLYQWVEDIIKTSVEMRGVGGQPAEE